MTQQSNAIRETAAHQRQTSAAGGESHCGIRQQSIVLALLATVVVLDQAAKWWGWRHMPAAEINYGSSPFLPSQLDRWYGEPVPGALLDVLDSGLLCIAVCLLLSRRRSVLVLGAGAVMLGGWGSNLLDRLGTHYWTAPNSMRGAVDFIDLGRFTINVADILILGATPLFLAAATIGYLQRVGIDGPDSAGSATRRWAPTGTRTPALTGAIGLMALAGLGATIDRVVTAPGATPGATVHSHRRRRSCPLPDDGHADSSKVAR